MIGLFEIACVFILMTGCSITDIRGNKIHVWWCIGFMIIGIVVELIIKQRGVFNICTGMIPGIFIYVTSIATRGGIGKGDSLMLIAAGFFIGIINCMILLFCSLLLVAVSGCFLLLFKKGNMKIRIPFAPFMAMSFIILIFLDAS